MKSSKSKAHYYDHTNRANRCGVCEYYHAGTCEQVEGRISPDGTCKYFERQEGSVKHIGEKAGEYGR